MELSEPLIQKLKADSNFNVFLEYIISKINELDTVDNLADLSNEMAGQEAKVRYTARNVLFEIFRPITDYQERARITKEMMEKRKIKYGLS